MSRPWMPLYVADYLADTAELDAAESGAYLHLIMHYWLNGGLPADEKRLARIARMTEREWAKARATIAEFFGEGWRHSRIDAELLEANEKYERRAMAGRKGGNAAAQTRQSSSIASSNADELLHQPQPQPEASPSLRSVEPSSLRSEASVREKSKRGVRLAGEWAPSETNISEAKGEGLSCREIEREAKVFRDYWLAQPGAKGVKLDWDATWRNWVRRTAEKLGRAPAAGGASAPPGKFYAAVESAELDAWDKHFRDTRGRGIPRDKAGGWLVDSQWPPGHVLAGGGQNTETRAQPMELR